MMGSIGKIKLDRKTGKVNFMTVIKTEELCRQITETINYYKTEAEEADARASKNKEEIKKDFEEEIEELKNKLRLCPFKFTKVEDERYTNFMQAHYLKGCNCNKGFSISFVGTGVGTCYDMICNDCGEKEEITDIDSW